jgi:hypothetical protein
VFLLLPPRFACPVAMECIEGNGNGKGDFGGLCNRRFEPFLFKSVQALRTVAAIDVYSRATYQNLGYQATHGGEIPTSSKGWNWSTVSAYLP